MKLSDLSNDEYVAEDELDKLVIEPSYSPTSAKRAKYEEEGYGDWEDNGDFYDEDVASGKEDMLLPEVKIEEKEISSKVKTEPVVLSAVRIDRSERFVRLSDASEKNGMVKCVWCDYTGRLSTTGYHQMNAHYWGNFHCPGTRFIRNNYFS